MPRKAHRASTNKLRTPRFWVGAASLAISTDDAGSINALLRKISASAQG
jgi:hypothetical protein